MRNEWSTSAAWSVDVATNGLMLREVGGWTFGFVDHGLAGKTSYVEEPLARDIDIAKRLGYGRHTKIRDLIKSLISRKKLSDVAVFPASVRTAGGRPAKEFWLTEAQALKVAAKSETDPADALLDEMIRVFTLARTGRLVPQDWILPGHAQKRLADLESALAAKEQEFAAERARLLSGQRSTICDSEFDELRGLLAEVVDLWLALGRAETKRAAVQLVKHRAIPGCFGKGFRLRYMPREQVPGILRALEVLRSDAHVEAVRRGLVPAPARRRHPILNLRK